MPRSTANNTTPASLSRFRKLSDSMLRQGRNELYINGERVLAVRAAAGHKLELTESRLGREIRDDAIEGAPRRGGIRVGRSRRLKSGSSCDCLSRLFILEIVPSDLPRPPFIYYVHEHGK